MRRPEQEEYLRFYGCVSLDVESKSASVKVKVRTLVYSETYF